MVTAILERRETIQEAKEVGTVELTRYSAYVVRKFGSKASGFDSGRKETEAEAVRECLANVAAGKGRAVEKISISTWTGTGDGLWRTILIGGTRRITIDDARKLVESADAVAAREAEVVVITL